MMSQHLPNWMAMISVREAKCDISRDISSIIHTHSARCIRAAPRSTLHPTNHNMTPEVDTKKLVRYLYLSGIYLWYRLATYSR